MYASDTETMRGISQAAFGQRYRLELMLAIADAEDGIVCLSDLSGVLKVTPSNLQKPLESLVKTGLLSAMPQLDSKRKYYFRNPSAAWQWARELAQVSQVDAVHPASPPW